MTPAPTLTRIEYWTDGEWMVGHAGIALIDPERYVKRLALRGVTARALPALQPCPGCGSMRCSGICLI